MKPALAAFALVLASLAMPGAAQGRSAPGQNSAPPVRETVKPLSRQPLPNLPGKEIIAVEVDFPPGAASVPHRHPPSAFLYAYVLEGEIVSAVGKEKPRAYRTGESWYEEPGAFHRVTRNASLKRPGRLLVIFITPAGEKELVRPLPDVR
jgi:quercetin dioxygenase-like cupin family protein